MSESFDSLYGRLAPVVEDLEQKRLALRSEGIRSGIITAVVIGLIGICLIPALHEISFVFLVVAIVAFFVVVNSYSSKVTAYYKENVVSQVVVSLLPGAVYEPDRGIPEAVFCDCGLFSTAPDRYSSEDCVTGRLDKTDLRFSEVHAQERHVSVDSKGRRSETWSDIFRGFLFEADFHKDFRGSTVLHRSSLFKFRFAEKRVKLESEAFEDCFDVYSTDELEARYLLSPSMMERLVALDRRMGGGITVSFYRSKVYIAIPDSKNHFESGVWTGVTREQLAAEFETIHDLVGMVDDMNLNLRIWTKE